MCLGGVVLALAFHLVFVAGRMLALVWRLRTTTVFSLHFLYDNWFDVSCRTQALNIQLSY